MLSRSKEKMTDLMTVLFQKSSSEMVVKQLKRCLIKKY